MTQQCFFDEQGNGGGREKIASKHNVWMIQYGIEMSHGNSLDKDLACVEWLGHHHRLLSFLTHTQQGMGGGGKYSKS